MMKETGWRENVRGFHRRAPKIITIKEEKNYKDYYMKTIEDYSKENRALRWDIKQLDSENIRLEKNKLHKQLEEAEFAIRNLKGEL